MEKLKNAFGLILIAFLCAYTVDGISQSKAAPKKEVVVVKKTIKNGVESVEKKVYSGEDMTDEEFKKMIESEDGDLDVNVWQTDDGKEFEIIVDDSGSDAAFMDASMEKFLKEKGISLDDVSNMNINIESSLENGKEVYHKVVSIESKNGETQVFKMSGDAAEMQELNEVHVMHLKDDHKPKLGVMIASVEEGVLIEEVIQGSPAEKAGLEKDDIILAVGDNPIASIDDLLEALDRTESMTVISFMRGAEKSAVKVELTPFDYEGTSMKKRIIKKYESKEK